MRLVSGKGPAASTEVRIDCACGDDTAAGVALALTGWPSSMPSRSAGDKKGEATEAYETAKQATTKAAKQLDEARIATGPFVRDALAGDKKPAGSKAAATTVNPEWAAVRRQLDHARQYRAGLLVDRTPLHPMVQAADDDVKDLEDRLTAIPHELVLMPGNLAEELDQMIELPTEMPGLTGPASKEVDRLDEPSGPVLAAVACRGSCAGGGSLGAQPGPAAATASRS